MEEVGHRRRLQDEATRVLDRWRRSGFDMIARYPSGYCYPVNSRAVSSNTTANTHLSIDSDDAVNAIVTAIEGGATYYDPGDTRRY